MFNLITYGNILYALGETKYILLEELDCLTILVLIVLQGITCWGSGRDWELQFHLNSTTPITSTDVFKEGQKKYFK